MGAQAGRIAIPDGDKFRQVCGPVFLAEGVDAVQPVADPLQSGGIGFDALAFGGGRGAQVLEFQYDRPQPVGDVYKRQDDGFVGNHDRVLAHVEQQPDFGELSRQQDVVGVKRL